MRRKLAYLRWLWHNRYEWWDEWDYAQRPPLTHREQIELMRQANTLRLLAMSARLASPRTATAATNDEHPPAPAP